MPEPKPSFDATQLFTHYFVVIVNSAFADLLVSAIRGQKNGGEQRLSLLADFIEDPDDCEEFPDDSGYEAVHLSEHRILFIFWEDGARYLRRVLEDRQFARQAEQGMLEPALYQLMRQSEKFLLELTQVKEQRQKYTESSLSLDPDNKRFPHTS